MYKVVEYKGFDSLEKVAATKLLWAITQNPGKLCEVDG